MPNLLDVFRHQSMKQSLLDKLKEKFTTGMQRMDIKLAAGSAKKTFAYRLNVSDLQAWGTPADEPALDRWVDDVISHALSQVRIRKVKSIVPDSVNVELARDGGTVKHIVVCSFLY
jgi:hypothetical protein